jgi:hypothetical protein
MGWAARTGDHERRVERRDARRLDLATAKLKHLCGTIINPEEFERVMATVKPHMQAEVRALLTPHLPYTVEKAS